MLLFILNDVCIFFRRLFVRGLFGEREKEKDGEEMERMEKINKTIFRAPKNLYSSKSVRERENKENK